MIYYLFCPLLLLSFKDFTIRIDQKGLLLVLQGISPDVVTYCTLMKAFMRGKKYEQVRLFFFFPCLFCLMLNQKWEAKYIWPEVECNTSSISSKYMSMQEFNFLFPPWYKKRQFSYCSIYFGLTCQISLTDVYSCVAHCLVMKMSALSQNSFYFQGCGHKFLRLSFRFQ